MFTTLLDHITKKVMLHLISMIMTYRLQWHCRWWCLHHIMLVLAPMVSHDQKSHIAPHFNHLHLRNLLVKLKTLFAPCDINTSDSGVIDQKRHATLHFNHLELLNTVVLLMMLSVSCDTSIGITWPKSYIALCFNYLDLTNKMVPWTMPWHCHVMLTQVLTASQLCHTLFQLSSPYEQNDAFGDAITITW